MTNTLNKLMFGVGIVAVIILMFMTIYNPVSHTEEVPCYDRYANIIKDEVCVENVYLINPAILGILTMTFFLITIYNELKIFDWI